MIIELALLPPAIAEQVKQQVEYGKEVQFAENGKVVANLSKPTNHFLSFYSNTPFDVADIELPEFDRSQSKFDDPFEND